MFRLKLDKLEQLKRIAKGRPLSDVIRDALDEYVIRMTGSLENHLDPIDEPDLDITKGQVDFSDI